MSSWKWLRKLQVCKMNTHKEAVLKSLKYDAWWRHVQHILTDFCALVMFLKHNSILCHEAGDHGVQCRNEGTLSFSLARGPSAALCCLSVAVMEESPPHCGRHARFSAIPFRVSVMKTNRKRGLLVLTAHKQHQNNLHMLFFFQEALLLSYLK